METRNHMEEVYRECKAAGLRAVARQLGLEGQQLVA